MGPLPAQHLPGPEDHGFPTADLLGQSHEVDLVAFGRPVVVCRQVVDHTQPDRRSQVPQNLVGVALGVGEDAGPGLALGSPAKATPGQSGCRG